MFFNWFRRSLGLANSILKKETFKDVEDETPLNQKKSLLTRNCTARIHEKRFCKRKVSIKDVLFHKMY